MTITMQYLSWICFAALILNQTYADTDCIAESTEKPSCQCTYNNFLIDLNKLFKAEAQIPLFSAKGSDPGNYTYSYQPCEPYSLLPGCNNVAVCQSTNAVPPINYNVGSPPKNVANFTGKVVDNALNITYIGSPVSEGGKKRVTTVMLRCANTAAKFRAFGETSPGSATYVLLLETDLVCLPPSVAAKKGLSTGSILCITLLVVIVVYLVVGYAVMYKVKGARGVEAIPNYTFWAELPGLVKDGFLFVAHGCKTENDRTYQQI